MISIYEMSWLDAGDPLPTADLSVVQFAKNVSSGPQMLGPSLLTSGIYERSRSR